MTGSDVLPGGPYVLTAPPELEPGPYVLQLPNGTRLSLTAWDLDVLRKYGGYCFHESGRLPRKHRVSRLPARVPALVVARLAFARRRVATLGALPPRRPANRARAPRVALLAFPILDRAPPARPLVVRGGEANRPGS